MKVLILANSDVGLYNFRLELIERLINEKHEVYVSCPYGSRIDELIELGIVYRDININRHGMNPFEDLALIKRYKLLMKELLPDVVFTYTIKPNIYGAIAARKCNIPCVANITGLGTAVENGGLRQKICVMLYKYAFKGIRKVFFQNDENRLFFTKHKIALGKHDLLPGSGVNLKRFSPLPFPDDSIMRFVFIGRIMKEKGIDYYLEAAKYIKTKYPNTEFHVCGFIEDEYKGKLQSYIDNKTIIYHGMVRDVREIHRQTHCTVFPSYYPEGISNVLLETAACARPIITTDRAGCREAVDDGVTGFIVPMKSQEALNKAINEIILRGRGPLIEMGLAGRRKMEKEFDRSVIVKKYFDVLSSL